MKLSSSIVGLMALWFVGPAAMGGYSATPHYRFHRLDVAAELGEGTSAFGINNRGVVVGNFVTVDGNVDGFVFDAGHFLDVVVPGASADDRGALEAVNDLGRAVGDFIDPDTGIQHAFVRRHGGGITVLPDAAPGALLTEGKGINNRGVIVGIYHDVDDNRHGFILHGGLYTTYDYPGAFRTLLSAINDHGQIVGRWGDADLHKHGFLLHHGVTSPIAVPGAVNTLPTGINNRGQVVGYFDDADLITHGFLLEDGKYTTLDFPGAANTALLAINDFGVIAGSYDDFSRGLVAVPMK